MTTAAYNCVGLTVKSQLDNRDEAVNHVLSILKELDISIHVDKERCGDIPSTHECLNLADDNSDIEVLVVIGGDGTIFRSVRDLAERNIPVLGVNRGGVGFLAEVDIDETAELLPALLRGEGVVEERSMLRVTAMRDDELFYEGHALNEAAIAQGAIARLLDVQASVQGQLVTTYRADGLVVSTPTGSTAYNISAGGPIVHPHLDATILTPLNPYSLSQKPIVVPGHHCIDLEVMQKKSTFIDNTVSLTIDGQVYIPIQNGDHITACLNDHKAKFLRRKRDTFFERLRTKLKWGG